MKIENYSNEPLVLNKNVCIGIASPYVVDGMSETIDNATREHCNSVVRYEAIDNATREHCDSGQIDEDNDEIFEMNEVKQMEIGQIINEKLSHLNSKDRKITEPVLREYSCLFYRDDLKLGCKLGVSHSIDTGNAEPIKKIPYRIPEGLKKVVKNK